MISFCTFFYNFLVESYTRQNLRTYAVPAIRHVEHGHIFKGERGDTHDFLIRGKRSHPSAKHEDYDWERGFWHHKENKFITQKEAGAHSTSLMTPAQRRDLFGDFDK